ncbi:hypothetical protein WISP_52152 [Willisornis vidua]|uniref:Uncharacterized protein n=1 Tax=Willisornis vidua TaxID=1566151 RepID=A0ABQ9DJ48_9PASS|nr:hypothetical protein WISP_52152 [Willisornis vidua]
MLGEPLTRRIFPISKCLTGKPEKSSIHLKKHQALKDVPFQSEIVFGVKLSDPFGLGICFEVCVSWEEKRLGTRIQCENPTSALQDLGGPMSAQQLEFRNYEDVPGGNWNIQRISST